MKRKDLMMKCSSCGNVFWRGAEFYGAQCPKCNDPHPAYMGVFRFAPVDAVASSPNTVDVEKKRRAVRAQGQIEFLKSTFGNDAGDSVRVVEETDEEVYYYDSFRRYCYLNKSEEGVTYRCIPGGVNQS